MSATVHFHRGFVDLRFERANGIDEIPAVLLEMKPEQIVPQQSIENLLLPWEGTEDLAVGPRNVPELSNDQI